VEIKGEESLHAVIRDIPNQKASKNYMDET